MEEGGSARWPYFESFKERRVLNAVDEYLARKAPIALDLGKRSEENNG